MIFFGAKSGQTIPGWSSSHVIYRITNAVLSSILGTNVVTTGLDHASVRSAITQFAEKNGKEERIAEPNRETGSVELDTIYEKIDKDTCFLAVIHTSNVTIGADAYVIAPYKNYGVKGCGYAHVSGRLAKLPHWKYIFKPETNWDLGGVEHQSYAAWSAVSDYLCWLGGHFTDSTEQRALVVAAMQSIKAHTTGLLSTLINGTDKTRGFKDMKHVTVYGMGEDLSSRACLVGFNLKGIESAKGCELYKGEQFRLHAPGQDPFFAAMLKQLGIASFIRLSACHYNTPEEIELFLKATASFAK
jgi:selenocysteine lyase/cysteine desulfurase